MGSLRFEAAIGAVIALAMPATAHAADLPIGDPYGGSTVSGSVYDWTGFYVGGHLGYGWASAGASDVDGLVGGLQGGYTMQSGRFVMGLEADVGLSDLTGSRGNFHASVDALGTARARMGVTFDQFLVYGTGGFGFGDVKVSDRLSRDDQWNLGWVLGLGVEAALTRNWTARVEAFHYDLGSSTFVLATGDRTISTTADVLRAGVNYRF